MKSIILVFFLQTLSICMAATAEQMLLAGRYYYRAKGEDGKPYFDKTRKEAEKAGFRKAYFTNANTRKNYIYSIDLDKIEETEIAFEQFAAQEGFAAKENSIGRKFLFIRFSSYNEITNLDVGVSRCHGYRSVIEKQAGSTEERIRDITVKCCF